MLLLQSAACSTYVHRKLQRQNQLTTPDIIRGSFTNLMDILMEEYLDELAAEIIQKLA